jgi:hypothetical protein
MRADPVRQHLDTRTEAELRWQVAFLSGTRGRLLRRAITPSRPALTPQQVDIAVLRAEGELAGYRLALLLIEGMGRTNRREREERVSRCVTTWSAAFRKATAQPGPAVYEQAKRPAHSASAVTAAQA